MPFYLRKSVSAGPFRFNFSKGGVGLSVGVKGFRVGTGPRGHYVHAGRGGIYYRASLGTPGRKPSLSNQGGTFVSPTPRREPEWSDAVDMIEIDSGEVLEMQDAKFVDLLNEINAKQQQLRLSALILGAAVALFLVGLVSGVTQLVAVAILGGLPAWLFGRWLDSYRRTTVLFYELEPEIASAYERLTETFDMLCACAGKWHIEASGAVRDLTTWKRNAGATNLIRRKPTVLTYKLPAVIKSNVTPPAIHVGKQVLYLFPQVMLVGDGTRFGAVGYQNLRVQCENSNFIEDGTVPRDAEVISHTWKHPNKGGGPDRRFNNNYQIPICRYEAMHFSSDSGLNELVEFSRTGVGMPFANALLSMPRHDEITNSPS